MSLGPTLGSGVPSRCPPPQPSVPGWAVPTGEGVLKHRCSGEGWTGRGRPFPGAARTLGCLLRLGPTPPPQDRGADRWVGGCIDGYLGDQSQAS